MFSDLIGAHEERFKGVISTFVSISHISTPSL